MQAPNKPLHIAAWPPHTSIENNDVDGGTAALDSKQTKQQTSKKVI